MLWKFLLTLASLFSYHDHQNVEHHEEFVPTPYGPQTLEEEAATRKALYGKHYGGDMIFPEGYNATNTGTNDEKFRWPGYPGRCVVPYFIDKSLDGAARKVIFQAIGYYNRLTCVRFVARTNERDYVNVFAGEGCWAVIGKAGGPQNLSLGKDCLWLGVVIHQLGHAIGLQHEHQRSDRDNYINVYKNNVKRGLLSNFDRMDPNYELIFTPYDYDSIMHHGSYAFSIEPSVLKTMEAKNGHRLFDPWQKPGFTKSDLVTIKKLYRC